MGLLTNKIEREELKPGDHIYTYRAIFAYSHHGNFRFILPKFAPFFLVHSIITSKSEIILNASLFF